MEPTPSGTIHGNDRSVREIKPTLGRQSGILVTEAIKMFEMAGYRKEEARMRAEFFTSLFSVRTLKITSLVLQQEEQK